MKKIREEFEHLPLVIEGCNGSLGLSLLNVLKTYDIIPPAIVLTTYSSPIDNDWYSLNTKILHIRKSTPDFRVALDSVVNSEPFNLFYAAGYGQPNKFMENPVGVIHANIEDFLFYSGKKIEYLAFMSTSEIYSGLMVEPVESSVPVSSPASERSIYIESKRLAEAICHQIISKNSVRYGIYRVALAFPPKLIAGDRRVLADLIRGGLENGVVTLNGGSEYLRQYQYGPNAILKILGSLVFGTSNLYNNSGSHLVSLGELARMIGKILAVPVEILFEEQISGAPSSVVINSDLVNNESRYLSMQEQDFSYYLEKMIKNTMLEAPKSEVQ